MIEPITLAELAEVGGSVRRRLVLAAVLAVGGAAAALAIPAFAGAGVDDLVGGDVGSLPIILAAIAGLLALRLLLDVAGRVVTGLARFEIVAAMRERWFGKIVAIPPGGEGEMPAQEWVSILSYDIPRVSEFVVDLRLSLIQAVCTLVGTAVLMWILSPLLTIGVVLIAPPAYFVARLAARRLQRRARRYWDFEIEVMTRADEAFRGRWAVQAFRQTERIEADFGEAVAAAERAAVDHLRLVSMIGPLTQFVAFLGMVGIVGLAVWMQLEIAPGELLSFVLYGLLLSQPLRAFANGFGLWHEARATLGRFDAVRAALADVAPAGSETMGDARGRLELRDLVFGWRDKSLFDHADLTIEAGEHVALVGPNGAGKTTVIALLLGFVGPQTGVVAVDGVDLATLTAEARRALFAVVPQQPTLVGSTVRECVRFGRPEASDAEVRDALRSALALDFVVGLPDGLDTRIGEEGARLSGGERQRLAVARALLVDTPILVLDEPTASYDEESTRAFVDRARELMGKRTVLWITHEDAPLAGMDRVVRLRAGKFASSAVGLTQAEAS